uniref:Uncharacterized protein n=1 Tax=Moniliophthora roreri TaxID=221103 RepID=A0A0W0G2C3_MONRR
MGRSPIEKRLSQGLTVEYKSSRILFSSLHPHNIMFAKQLPAFLIVLFCGLSAIAAPKDTSKCSSVSKTHIGEKKQVLLETKNCGGEVNSVADSKIAKDGNSNPTNVCGAKCEYLISFCSSNY